MAKRIIFLLLATTMLSAPAVLAAPHMIAPQHASGRDVGIVAVVGGDAISSIDLDNRIRFLIANARLSNTPDVIEKIRPQIMRSMIDEKLQLQEAKKLDITVTDADIADAIAGIEQQHGMPKDTVYHLLDDNHIPRETFTNQIRAQLAWSQIVGKKIRPQVRVSDAEIALASHHFVPPAKKPAAAEPGAQVMELKISVIILPVDKAGHEQEIKKLGEKLVKEVRGGADFEEVSRHFSSATANNGGKVEAFWIKIGQLDPNIAKLLAYAQAGQITDPLRFNEGFTIIKVYDVHTMAKKAAKPAPETEAKPQDTEVLMKEILLKLKPDAQAKEADMMLHVGEEVAKNPGSCEDKGVAGLKDAEDFDIQVNFKKSMLSELPPAIKIIANNLKPGEISSPFASLEGIRLYMLCEKKEVEAKAPDHEEVYRLLTQQKMELEAQKYMRNLHREVYIDIR